MYQNILVAIDPWNPTNVDHAIEAAKKLKSEEGKITLVTVLTSVPPYAAEYLPVGQSEHNRKEAESKLTEYAADDQMQTLAISSPSSAGATLIELSVNNAADLIIIASHRPGLQDYFLGSTAGRVVRHSPCAVHVVR